MGEWKKIKLKEVLTEVTERNKNERVKNVLSVTNSRGFISQEEYFEGTVHSQNISNYKIVRKNQFAYNPSRINVGSIDILTAYDEGALSPMYVVFEVNGSKLLPEYFKYYFQTHRFAENVKNNTQGSVRNSLSFKALADFEYFLPTIEEQEEIVKILEKVDLIIKKYEKLLEEKNRFIKSQFVEMFGNPITNNKNWQTIKGKELFVFSSGKGNPTKNLDDNNEFPCYGGNGITGYSKDYLIDYDTLVIGRVGAYCGSVHRTTNKVWITDNAIYIKMFKSKINLKYLEQLLLKINIHNFANATGQPKITQEPLESFEYIQPPIELQNRFEGIVQLIDKQKFELEKIIDNYKKLKKGLMQQLLTGKIKVKI